MLREMVQRLSLPVRFVIVAVKTSGGLPYEERLDFAFIASQIETGAASYVAYRQPDRIARHMLPAENFYHHLEQHGVDLYLSPRVVAEHLLGDRDVAAISMLGRWAYRVRLLR